jgi:hypothetical protein
MNKSPKGWTSVWQGVVRDKHGRLKQVLEPHLNLRTNAGADWQARVMEGDSAAMQTGTASATTATTLTTTSLINHALKDHLIAVGPNASGTGAVLYGVCSDNSTTVITVDKWYVPATPAGAAGGPPNATCTWMALPGSAPLVYLAVTSDSGSPNATDTTLASELAVNGFTRAYYTTLAHTTSAGSFSIAVTFTASGTETINKEAVFTAATIAAGGSMAFESAEPSPPTLISGDTLAQTVSISF